MCIRDRAKSPGGPAVCLKTALSQNGLSQKWLSVSVSPPLERSRRVLWSERRGGTTYGKPGDAPARFPTAL
eukprot:2019831-Alexandrium_andersonii.AAC.1